MTAVAPVSQQQVRRRNLSRVLHTVAEGPVSRADVATRLGLTRPAVSTLVEELLRAGLLVELGPGRSSGVGRPGSALALADRGPCGVGAEVGVDHLTVTVVDLRGQVRVRHSEAAANRDSDPAAVLARLAELVEQARSEAAAEGLRPSGLALAVPGLVTRETSTVVAAPNLGWHRIDAAALLGSPLPLRVDNEANFGALAQLWLGGDGQPRPERDFIHVSARVGIGAALVVHGELLRGARGFAGELGHVPVWPEGRPCACGGRGCLEQYAGESAVLAAAGEGTEVPKSPTAALAVLGTRADGGDVAARRALRTAGRALGIALAGAVNLLDPHAVVLGGAPANLGPWLLPPLKRELERRTALQGPGCEVRISALGNQGPVLGAAHTVVRNVLDDPLAVTAPQQPAGTAKKTKAAAAARRGG